MSEETYQYELTVTRRQPNPEFKENRSGYGVSYGQNPERFISRTKLTVVLTEKEFDAVRKACLEVMP